MEYWEGFFLGPFWTDSDYKDRRHKTLFIGISLIIFALMVLQILMPGKISKLFVFPIQVNFILGFLLLIGLPFLASRYYQLNPVFRILILFAYILQYLFLFLGFIQLFTRNFELDLNSMPDFVLTFFDGLMVISSNIFNFLGSLGSTIASVAFGIIVGGIVGLFVIFICICLPLIYLISFRQLQRLIDRILYKKKMSGNYIKR